MDEAGVAKTAIVHASTVYGFDNSLVADAVSHFPQRCAAIGSIDMLTPDAVDVAKGWIARGVTGFRIFTGGSTKSVDASTLDDARSYPVWELCGERGAAICPTRHLGIPATIALARRFPRVPDHRQPLRPSRRQRRGAPYAESRSLISFSLRCRTSISSSRRWCSIACGKPRPTRTRFLPRSCGLDVRGRPFSPGLATGPNSPGTLKDHVTDAKAALASLAGRHDAILGGTALQNSIQPLNNS